MEAIHEISDKFFLLKKRMRDIEITKLSTKSNASFYNIMRSLQSKKTIESLKSNHRFVLENVKKTSQPELDSNAKVEVNDYQGLSPASSAKKKLDKKTQANKKLNSTNKLPRDDLINIAFNQNPPKVIYPQPKKEDRPKQASIVNRDEPMKEKDNDNDIRSNILWIGDKRDNNSGDRTPAVENYSSSDSFIKELIHDDKDNNKEREDIVNNNNHIGGDKDNDQSISEYFDKKEIFDSNNIFNDDDDIMEDKAFDDECNNRMKVMENNSNEELAMKREQNKVQTIENPINTISIANNELKESTEKTKAEELVNDDKPVETIDSKVIISLKGFENFDFSKNEYFNNYIEDNNIKDDKLSVDNEGNGIPVTPPPIKTSIEHVEPKNKDNKPKEEIKKSSANEIPKSLNKCKKNNKIIDDDDEREYVYLDEKKDKDKDKDKNKLLNSNNITKKAIESSNKNLKEKQPIPSLSKPPMSSIKPNNKPQPNPQSAPKTSSLKPREPESTHSHHYYHHHHNSNINNITVINNTIIPSSSTNASQVPQTAGINNEIKKKEYDILCLSILNTTLSKIKSKLLASNEKTALPSSINTNFDEMINMTNQLRKEDQSKRIKLIIEKTMKLLVTLFDIFEKEAKREQYIYDILQILDVIDSFQHKTKDNYGDKMPQSFKTIKLVFKYIFTLFKMKSYTTNYLKNLVEQEETPNKNKNLMKFAKTYKSFNNSVDKLKKILLKDSTEERKQKKLNEALYIYLKTNPNAIKYSKCFKVGKKFIEYIFDYLANK